MNEENHLVIIITLPKIVLKQPQSIFMKENKDELIFVKKPKTFKACELLIISKYILCLYKI